MPLKILEAVYRNRHDELAGLLAAAPALTLCEAAAVGDARLGHVQLSRRLRGETP
jgi:hypothetical protein